MVTRWRKVVATTLFALVLAPLFHSQQPDHIVASEAAVASAFERAMQAEGGPRLKRIYEKRIQELCTADARRWGDGIVGYDRVSFANEEELASKMLALVRQWKTTSSQHPLFDASDFPRLRRYAVANCGALDGQTKVAVAVYRSAWDTYWANWANLLGR